MRLLLAEDDIELALILEETLVDNHYSIDVVNNGVDAFDWAMCTEYDGIILDIVMPGMSGLEVVQALRQKQSNVPILLLTVKDNINDLVLGLDTGADDYLTKPFATKELLARIRAITRRQTKFSGNVLEISGLTLNRKTFELSFQTQNLRLRNKEYQMIELLMRNPDQYISVNQMIDQIWGYNTESEINVVWVHISSLRKKLLHLKAPIQIKAARGIGYKIEPL